MRILRYMLVPWTAFFVYAFFTFFLGQNGLYTRKHLEAERLRLQDNQKSLENTKKDYLKTKNNLISDHDTLSVYARQLGYGTEDEKFVRIKGLSVAVNTNIPEGRVLYAAAPEFVSDRIIKLISAFFAFLVLVFFLISDSAISRTNE